MFERKRNDDIMKRLAEERNDTAQIASNETSRVYASSIIELHVINSYIQHDFITRFI